VFILEHYFSSKSFAAVREAFSNVCPDKEVQNEATIHRLVRTFRDKEEFVCDSCSSSDKTAAIMAVPISSSASAATMEYCCKNSVLPASVSSFCA
jgi:hypothetical protein